MKIAFYTSTLIGGLVLMGLIALHTPGPLHGKESWYVVGLMLVVYGSFIRLHRELEDWE